MYKTTKRNNLFKLKLRSSGLNLNFGGSKIRKELPSML